MFRRVEEGLPPDPTYPADLKDLGYFVNESGHVRMIAYPDKGFQYHYSNTERHNEVRREAMQICQRNEVDARLAALGIGKLYLPTFTTTRPKALPHIPILAPPADVLKTRKRVIVLINDILQDLGILAYWQLQRELGLNGGSVINFTKEIIHRSTEQKDGNLFHDRARIDEKAKGTPGLIVMNNGQRFYSHKFNKPMTLRSWNAQPRKSLCHDVIKLHEMENKVEGHRTPEEHIKYVFDHVIKNPEFVAPDAEIYVIAIENGAETFLNILGSNMEKYGRCVTAMAIVQARVMGSQISNPDLKAFLHQRCRQWEISSLSIDPKDCVGKPLDRIHFAEHNIKEPKSEHSVARPINWLEPIPPSGVASTISGLVKRLTPSNRSRVPERPVSDSAIFDDEPLCPTFAGGNNGIGECVFTDPAVYEAILDFFAEVAQNPMEFNNPDFNVTVPEPNTEHEADEGKPEGSQRDAKFGPLLPPEMSLEQMEIQNLEGELKHMKEALAATPKNDPAHEEGRRNLEKRIAKTVRGIEGLKKRKSATGGLDAGQAQELGGNWKPVGKGPKISFAGTMVDSDLVKGAGLIDTAEALVEVDSGKEEGEAENSGEEQ
ncbi:hypothetical protein K469DRAFT_750686 [Zopfia rhizophila CBS 207.26]|uniref:Arb2 domain-containing protein n=1 Tax=Zopfia rhizophila CBS 207.26 TaxID=1314779 RepID=A0A6A6E3U0_9PEZI|nr:hypothetical protein K469DRAFT_750686 [Zopfia rhizophila CBS 207.26]